MRELEPLEEKSEITTTMLNQTFNQLKDLMVNKKINSRNRATDQVSQFSKHIGKQTQLPRMFDALQASMCRQGSLDVSEHFDFNRVSQTILNRRFK